MTPDTKSDYQLMSAEQQNARGSRMKHVILRACTLLMDNDQLKFNFLKLIFNPNLSTRSSKKFSFILIDQRRVGR